EVEKGSAEEVLVVLKNTGNGEAVNILVFVEASPEIDVIGVSGYRVTLPAGGETTAMITVRGREKGEYTAAVTVSYEDKSKGIHTASGLLPVSIVSGILLVLVLATGAVAAVGIGVYILIRRTITKATQESSEEGEQK
ncbi:MAG: hypothetical protein HXS48_21775, partial [Theionarchaea archaeon]|nr:hypothetical protein [Theionarchaea archaeon]